MESKPVKDSYVEMVQIVQPSDTNALGTAFGGTVVAWMDTAAAISAVRHARQPCVTASIDSLSFLNPINLGDHVIIEACVNYTGRTSMEVGVHIQSENPMTGERKETTSGYLTFVAIGQGGPIPIPQVVPETDVEQMRYEEAKLRKEYKLKIREEIGN